MQADYFAFLSEQAASLLLPIVFRDDSLIVVNKPAGLLSVPGRRLHLPDSVVSRLRHYLPEHAFLQAVHRLDQDTSGLLVIACSPEAHRDLSRQFAQRQVHKTYEAVLSRPVLENQLASSSTITLPLSADPSAPPKQRVDLQQGKPAVTAFNILSSGKHPRVEFAPQTGRTHQLRLHAAHSDGLRSPILGDELYDGRLYGKQDGRSQRLHLHATTLLLIHPITRRPLSLSSPCPF